MMKRTYMTCNETGHNGLYFFNHILSFLGCSPLIDTKFTCAFCSPSHQVWGAFMKLFGRCAGYQKTYEKHRLRNLQKVVIGLAVLGDDDSKVFLFG